MPLYAPVFDCLAIAFDYLSDKKAIDQISISSMGFK
jgi:hypothetical protein